MNDLTPSDIQNLKETPPNFLEGYTSTLLSAVDLSSLPNLSGVLRSYAQQVVRNIDDFDLPPYDNFPSISDVAYEKARLLHEKTGMSVIASQTSVTVSALEQKSYKELDFAGLSKVSDVVC